MAGRIEDYALIGDCESAALVGRDGSIDWLCWPRFDSDACFAALLGSKRARPLPHRAARGRSRKVTRRYRPDTLILETRFEDRDGAVTLIDFMPIRGRNPDCVRIVQRRARARRDVRRAGPALRLRRDRALGAQARRRHAARDRRPRHGGAAHAGAPARREHDHGRRIHRGRRRSRAFRAELRAVASAVAGAFGRCRARATPRATGSSGPRKRAGARPVEGRGRPLAHHAEGADLRARPAASWRRRPPRCPSGSAATATGTTASAGCATRR